MSRPSRWTSRPARPLPLVHGRWPLGARLDWKGLYGLYPGAIGGVMAPEGMGLMEEYWPYWGLMEYWDPASGEAPVGAGRHYAARHF